MHIPRKITTIIFIIFSFYSNIYYYI